MSASAVLLEGSISAVVNILLFSAVPLAWHLGRERTWRGLLRSLGLYRPKSANLAAIAVPISVVYLMTLAANLAVILSGNSGRSPADTQGLTPVALFALLLLYGIKTGVAEEVLFRGFIAKRLIGKLGLARGNAIQAGVFALPHFVVNGYASPVDLAVRIVNAFLLGYTFGYVMERQSDGSILPVMVAHVLINMTSSLVLSVIL